MASAAPASVPTACRVVLPAASSVDELRQCAGQVVTAKAVAYAIPAVPLVGITALGQVTKLGQPVVRELASSPVLVELASDATADASAIPVGRPIPMKDQQGALLAKTRRQP